MVLREPPSVGRQVRSKSESEFMEFCKYHYAGHVLGSMFCYQRGEQKPADGLILSVFWTLEQFSAMNEEHYIQMKLCS